jgi:hypothetical protein
MTLCCVQCEKKWMDHSAIEWDGKIFCSMGCYSKYSSTHSQELNEEDSRLTICPICGYGVILRLRPPLTNYCVCHRCHHKWCEKNGGIHYSLDPEDEN